VGLAFVAFQFRQDGKTRRFQTYEKLRSDFTDIVMKLVDKPKVSEYIYLKENKPGR
jgi:hypothetical protein